MRRPRVDVVNNGRILRTEKGGDTRIVPQVNRKKQQIKIKEKKKKSWIYIQRNKKKKRQLHLSLATLMLPQNSFSFNEKFSTKSRKGIEYF